MKMTTETISVKRDPTIDFFLDKIANKKTKYVVMIDGEPRFEVNPVIADDDTWDTVWTKENENALQVAEEELKKGESLIIEDMSSLNADEFWDLIGNHSKTYDNV